MTITATKAFRTFLSSPARPRIADAVEVILTRIADGEKATAIIKPPRTGKSNVIRLAAIEGVETGLIAGAVVLAPWLQLRKQIINIVKIQTMAKQFKIPGTIRIKTTEWESRTITTDFLRSTPCHLHSFTLSAARRPTCMTILIDTARYCREVLGKPLLILIDEGHMVAGKDGWGDLAIQLSEAGAHVVLLTGTPDRADNLAPFGFRTTERLIAKDIEYRTFGPKIGDQRMIQERRADRVAYRLDADFTMTLREAWDVMPSLLCRLRVRWVSCKINGVDLVDVEDDDLRAVVQDPGFIETAIDILLDEVALRRSNKTFASTGFIVYVGSDYEGETKDAHAKLVMTALQRKWEARFRRKGLIELATLNENDEGHKALDIIQRFCDGHSDGIVVKQMGGVGLDVERLKVALDLSTIRTPGNWVQRMLRVATLWDDMTHGTLILPETRKTRTLYKETVEDEGGDLTKLVNSDVIDEWEAPAPGDDPEIEISDAEASGASDMADDFSKDTTSLILRVMRLYPQLGKLSFPDVKALIEAGGIIVPASDDNNNQDDEEETPVTVVNVGDAAEEKRKQIYERADELASREIAYMPANRTPWVNARKKWIGRAREAAGILCSLPKCQDINRLQAALDFLKVQ